MKEDIKLKEYLKVTYVEAAIVSDQVIMTFLSDNNLWISCHGHDLDDSLNMVDI